MLQIQSVFRTFFYAFHTQNAFRCVSLPSRIAWNFYIHGIYLFTFAAGDAFIFVYFNPKKRKVTHRFQKSCNRANVLTESSIVMKFVSYDNSGNIVENISNNKAPPQDFAFVRDLKKPSICILSRQRKPRYTSIYRPTPNCATFRAYFFFLIFPILVQTSRSV